MYYSATTPGILVTSGVVNRSSVPIRVYPIFELDAWVWAKSTHLCRAKTEARIRTCFSFTFQSSRLIYLAHSVYGTFIGKRQKQSFSFFEWPRGISSVSCCGRVTLLLAMSSVKSFVFMLSNKRCIWKGKERGTALLSRVALFWDSLGLCVHLSL